MINTTNDSTTMENLRNKNKWRITIGNINSFPSERDGHNKHKLDVLKNLVINNNSDMILISEHNRNARHIKKTDTPAEIMKKWWTNTIVRSAYLTSNNQSSFEPGGTMIVTHSRATAHTCSAEVDRFHLGRWNSITLKGKNSHYTTLISIYRPSRYQETYLRQTAHTAKRRKVTPTLSPEDMWYIDLRDLIREKIGLGHEVIVAGDFNDDLNNENSRTHKFMVNLGLRELLLEKYGKGPATHIRGSSTIDGIFATAKIHMDHGIYLPFDKGPSDHRWMVIDISERSLLGTPRDELAPQLLRKTTSKIPSVKKKFQELVDSQIIKYNLHTRINRLHQRIVEGNEFSTTDAKEYEIIEERLQRAVKYADNHCRKARMGRIPFSPIQKQLMGEIIILRHIKLRMILKGLPNRPRSKRIDRLVRKYQYSGEKTFQDVKTIDTAIQQAIKKYNSFRDKAQSSRWFYLEQIARELDENDGKGRQFHYKILHQREATKEFFKAIRYSEGKNCKGGVDKIQIGEGDQATIIYDKEQIENEIMKVNQQKLLQASDTPLRQFPISELLGEQGDFVTWERIILGNMKLPDGVDEGLSVWFTYITNIKNHTPMDFTWTTEEYIQSWRKMKETKTTIPGIQVAHLKCLDSSSCTADVVSKLALIPLMAGYSPKTWQWGIDSMIPKKVADLRPNKLRLILLMDARFNHSNKLIGKKMMEYGEAHNLLAPEQFGSRQCKSAIEHAVNKRLVMDTIRQSGTNAVYVANDAKSCYDRILLMVAYLTMRKFGIPSLVAKSTISTILLMKHKVRTKYGDSTSYYGGDKWETRPHGCGQGNGYGPALWACISSPLLHLMREKGFGTKITCPTSNNPIHITAFAFVDDVDIIQTQHQHASEGLSLLQHGDSLLNTTQSALNQWESTLRVTEGALEPSKTFYVPIAHEWKGSRKQVTLLKLNGHLHLKDGDGNKAPLTQYVPTQSFFTLGIWQSPSGTDQRQQEHLIQKIHMWGSSTTIQKITWAHARIAVRATIGKTLTYPLPATAFNTNQCAVLQRELLKTILGKMGVVRTTPPLIAMAPRSFGGLGIFSFEIQQLLSHINLILLHGPDTMSMTHSLLRASMEYYSLETGLPGDPLQLPYVEYVTPNTWIAQTIFGMRKYGIEAVSGFHGLEAWCDQDAFIMEKMRYYFSTETLCVANKVRLHLRIVTLSDLLTADGKYYNTELLKGFRNEDNPSPSHLRYQWPEVPTPSPRERSTWFHCLITTFDITLAIDQRRHGVSHQWNEQSLHYSHWLLSQQTQTLYQNKGNNTWQQWHQQDLSGNRYNTRSTMNLYVTGQLTNMRPSDCRPVSILREGHHIRPSGNVGHMISIVGLRPRAAVHFYEGLLHGSTNITATNLGSYLYHIQLDNGVIVTDGSYDKGSSTFAFLAQPIHHTCDLHNVRLEELIWGSGRVDGSSHDANSYRAELAGILSAITFTNTQCRAHNVNQGHCKLYCDSKGALIAAFGYKRPTPRWSSYDLIWRIRKALQASPIRWSSQHVLGHQDASIDFTELDHIAQGNTIVDHLANQRHLDPHVGVSTPQPWSLRAMGCPIGGNVDFQLQEAIFRPLMVERWSQLFGLPLQAQTRLNWDMFFQSMATQSPPVQTFLTKFNARLLPVGTNLKRRRHSDMDTCPCCGEIEDHIHLVQCQQVSMTTTYNEFMVNIQEILQGNTTSATINGLTWLLQSFRNPTSATTFSTGWVNKQMLLGPRAFFAGLWLNEWVSAQETYHDLIKSPRSANLWTKRLIHTVQLLPYQMWKTRNQVLHHITENHVHQRVHAQLNEQIDAIFSCKPHPRLMAHCDNLYFSRHDIEKIKQMTMHRKQNWVAGAHLILTKYERRATTQSQRFTSFFQWDRG